MERNNKEQIATAFDQDSSEFIIHEFDPDFPGLLDEISDEQRKITILRIIQYCWFYDCAYTKDITGAFKLWEAVYPIKHRD